MRGKAGIFSLGLALTLVVAACSPGSRFGLPRGLDMAPAPQQPQSAALAPAQGEIIGSGPVRVALILPLSGNAASVGQSMANGARLGMDHVIMTGGQNIHLVLKDSGSSAQMAQAATQQAIAEGAELIVGPLTADAVALAGATAKSSGVPLIGFSSTAAVATDGVYLLSVLPEAEIMRSLSYARAQGRQSIAAAIPDTPLGQVQAEIIRQAAAELGLRIVSVEMFDSEARARTAIERLAPAIRTDQIDLLYLPDRATAPSLALLLDAARVPQGRVMIVGSAEWEGDGAIGNTPYLSGAVYPAIDPAGLSGLSPRYQARFGVPPHQFATLAFTAALLANNSVLSQAVPRYGAMLVSPGGFTGNDGPFRFHTDGRGEYGLVMRQVQPSGASTIDAARLGGLPLAALGGGGL